MFILLTPPISAVTNHDNVNAVIIALSPSANVHRSFVNFKVISSINTNGNYENTGKIMDSGQYILIELCRLIVRRA